MVLAVLFAALLFAERALWKDTPAARVNVSQMRLKVDHKHGCIQ
jgi:hypothetical protein